MNVRFVSSSLRLSDRHVSFLVRIALLTVVVAVALLIGLATRTLAFTSAPKFAHAAPMLISPLLSTPALSVLQRTE